jgi:hypothetical protein
MSDHLILLERVHGGGELVDIEAIRVPQGSSLDIPGMV